MFVLLEVEISHVGVGSNRGLVSFIIVELSVLVSLVIVLVVVIVVVVVAIGNKLSRIFNVRDVAFGRFDFN